MTRKRHAWLFGSLLLLTSAGAPAQDAGQADSPNMPAAGAGSGMGSAAPGGCPMADGAGMGMGSMGMGSGAMGSACPGMTGDGMMGMDMMGMMGMMDGRKGGYGLGPIHKIGIDEAQEQKIAAIHDQLRRQNWDRLGKIMDERARLRDIYRADAPDPKAVGEVYGRICALNRQMIEARVEATNRMLQVLTEEQRQQLQELKRSRSGMGMGMGMRHRQGASPH